MKYLPIAILFSLFSFAQKNYPKDFFAPPLDIPLQLNGNFGELRPNHFHAGFDLKTNQKEGLKVYAVGDGYISRIKISTAGYGKAIYITHPNGYTSVYGHLQRASGVIQDKIIEAQYKEKEYEVEIFLKPTDLPVKKGDVIAYSGNTGGSEGPHLHFEIRDSSTEKVVNPLYFGFDKQIIDTRKPVVSSLMVYPIDENATVNQSKRPLGLNLSLQADGTYLSEKVFANGRIGFAINASDQDNVSFNNNGVFKAEILDNGKPVFGYKFDEMVFDEARYVNAFIDYGRYKKTHQRVQKLFMVKPYSLSNIKDNVNDGIFNVTPNFTDVQRIEVSDFNNNKTIISIPIEYSADESKIPNDVKKTPYFIKSNRESLFEKENVSVLFPAGIFYNDFYMNFDVKNNVATVHEDVVPVHSNFTITFETKLSGDDLKKSFIASKNGNKLGYLTTKANGSTLSARTRTLGQFTIAKDSIAPKVSISKNIEGKNLTDKKSISVTISDDLSGVNSYNGYLNGKWILMEYEPKLKRLTHNFDDGIDAEGENTLKVIATDNVGNSTTFETHFIRSQKK